MSNSQQQRNNQCVQRGLKNGKISENKFKLALERDGFEVIWSEENEDKIKHWDVAIIGKNGDKFDKPIRIDVKMMKKIRSKNSNQSSTHHYVEFQNINGNTGWVLGEADYIAFEAPNKWIIVDREKLAEETDKKVEIRTVWGDYPRLYHFYRRKNYKRMDTVVLVENSFLESLTDKFLKKI